MYRNFGGAMPAEAGSGAGIPSAGLGLNDVSNVAGNSVRHLGDAKRKILSRMPKDQFPRQNIFFNGFSRGRLYKFAESTDDVTKEPDTSAADKAGDALKKSADEFKALTHSYVQHNMWRFMPVDFAAPIWSNQGSNIQASRFAHDYTQAGKTIGNGVKIQGRNGDAMAQRTADGRMYYKGNYYTPQQLASMKG